MVEATSESTPRRVCISRPPLQILDAARYLDAAVTAHLQGKSALAAELIGAADMPDIYKWLKPVWADSSIHLQAAVDQNQPSLVKDMRVKVRMPSGADKQRIHQRDGFNCRFCDMPVIRPEIRTLMRAVYPSVLRWGRTEAEQHAAFQAMWAQYDHVLPHARGGTNDLDNLVLACAACNFGRGGFSLEDVGVEDPRQRLPTHFAWDGLERFR